MPPSRRLSNGRSPLVAKQRQITNFFTPGKSSPAPVSSPTPTPPSTNKQQQQEVKKKKPLLVVGHTVASPAPVSDKKKPYSTDVVGKRIRVYWPLDEAWYGGIVRSFDERAGKHVVGYDDGQEEVLDLAEEKVEWPAGPEAECDVAGEEETPVRRLRKGVSGISVAEAETEMKVVEETPVLSSKGRRLRKTASVVREAEEEVEIEEGSSPMCDSSEDEDWGKTVGKMVLDSSSEDDDEMELEAEVIEAKVKAKKSPPNCSTKVTPPSTGTKRAKFDVQKVDSAKKLKISGNGLLFPDTPAASPATEKGNSSTVGASSLTGEAAERFAKREAEKFRFLQDRKDANRRRPGDVNYDPKTLYLPPDFLRSLSDGQRQWWEFKSKHMDKVLFFKMGKFYELFEMDAHVGAKELDLQYMKGDQPHCGFPEKNFSSNVEKLARKGYRVLVVEQTETPHQLEVRRREGSKDKVVKREICAVVTKGTMVEGEFLSAKSDASYLLSLTEMCQNSEKQGCVMIGVCVADASTSKFMLGQFEDDLDRHRLCSLLSELRPVEIIKPKEVLSAETETILLKHTRSPLINDLIPKLEFWDAEQTIVEIEESNIWSSYNSMSLNSDNCSPSGKGERDLQLPDILSDLINAGPNGKCALSAFGGCLFYLRQALLDETLLRCAKFEVLPLSSCSNILHNPYMILDAAALENLEILENNNGSQTGTLLAQLNHCVTQSGKRLLRSWLVRPLFDRAAIRERQDAIAEINGASEHALQFRKDLSGLPDMERLLARLFGSCEANGRNASKVVLYEDAAKKQLKEFIGTLRGCQLMTQACSSMRTILANNKSDLLHHLLTPGMGIPDVLPVLKHFEGAFDWSDAEKSGRIVPLEGADEEYDCSCRTIKKIELQLTRNLKEQQMILDDNSVKYVTVGKDQFLLEVPDHLRSKIPSEYELQSSKKGYFRYWTPKIKKWLSDLTQAENGREVRLKTVMQKFIEDFSRQHSKWRQLVSTVAELDVLISLAISRDYYEGPTCHPDITDTADSGGAPSLSAKCLGHPLLRSDSLGKGSFVPNDVNIGGASHPSFILLTGPNMGGKSTLLRQVCLAVILAQIGAYVPAEHFKLSPVDRVFVRMGAKDHIMAGQSTFLTELSETASMLSSATSKSLVALDELGRGTSTSDGQAIADSVLRYCTQIIRCRGLFSTHYHLLALDYERDPRIFLCHMACHVGQAVNGVEKVTFLYSLTPGSCPKSYGINVARLAGLPDSVLQKAAIKSSNFETTYGKKKKLHSDPSVTFPQNDMTVAVQHVLQLTTRGCKESTCTQTIIQLTELQDKVRVLIQEV